MVKAVFVGFDASDDSRFSIPEKKAAQAAFFSIALAFSKAASMPPTM
jgi:hypothetical protein